MSTETIDPTPVPPTPRKSDRPELFAAAHDKLSLLERANIRFIRGTFTIRPVDRLLTFLSRTLGAGWVHHCTKYIRLEYGLERLPAWDPRQSFIVVSNHRSFFDMFVINAILYRHGYHHRLLFPVRSNFFYDNPLGFFVNAVMSFWSMYPPIFRDRKKAVLNHTAFSEMTWTMKQGTHCAGIHPEGTRKKDDDPYTFLPAQSGVGRAIHHARVPVYPVFINGLGNDLPKQVWGNFNKKGKKILVVFGEPIEWGTLLDEPASGKVYKQIADRAMEIIGELGQEEKKIRAALPGSSGGGS